MPEESKKKSGRGGKRNGAGRPPGSLNRASPQQRKSIAELARKHCPDALKALVDIAQHGTSEAARVSAATAILDRGYGRAPQAVELSGPEGDAVQLEIITK